MTAFFKTILCSIDFSVYSSQVVAWASTLAAGSGAELVVFHAVTHPRERLALPHSRLDVFSCPAKARERMETVMAGAAVPWTPVILQGDPVSGVCQVADQTGADLIVAASHGLSGIRRMVLGSVVERMAREIHSPLLILRSREDGAPGHPAEKLSLVHGDAGPIAAACDLEPDAPPVGGYAHFLATVLNRRLLLVHAAGSPVQADEAFMDESYSGRQERLLKMLMQKMLSQVPGQNPETLDVAAEILTGDPAEEILDVVKSSRAALVVVGVKHRSVLGKWFTGSTTETMIRSSPCHVLTVPVMAGGRLVPGTTGSD